MAAEDEAFFLGLRLNRGIDLDRIAAEFGDPAITKRSAILNTLTEAGLLEHNHSIVRLTDRGRLLSNEVFERLMLAEDSSNVGAPSLSQSDKMENSTSPLITLRPIS
jgi:oxygen-independent coproporphyrinogen-3 oxidase